MGWTVKRVPTRVLQGSLAWQSRVIRRSAWSLSKGGLERTRQLQWLGKVAQPTQVGFPR